MLVPDSTEYIFLHVLFFGLVKLFLFVCLFLPDKSPQFAEVNGAVLVFLPGLAHIQQLYDLLSSDKRFRDKNR